MTTAAETKARIENEISEFIGKKCQELNEATGLHVMTMEILPRPMLKGSGVKGPTVRMTLI